MSTFYKQVSKRHLQKLREQRDYYIEQMRRSQSKVSIEAFELMVDFYSALIKAAQKHIRQNSRRS